MADQASEALRRVRKRTGSQASAIADAVAQMGATLIGSSVIVDQAPSNVRTQLNVVGLLRYDELPEAAESTACLPRQLIDKNAAESLYGSATGCGLQSSADLGHASGRQRRHPSSEPVPRDRVDVVEVHDALGGDTVGRGQLHLGHEAAP